MFDMGFIKDIKKIMKHVPEKRQTMLFSATMPEDIKRLCKDVLKDPVTATIGSLMNLEASSTSLISGMSRDLACSMGSMVWQTPGLTTIKSAF
jgi:superfamily II DNA/RNA helicase